MQDFVSRLLISNVSITGHRFAFTRARCLAISKISLKQAHR